MFSVLLEFIENFVLLSYENHVVIVNGAVASKCPRSWLRGLHSFWVRDSRALKHVISSFNFVIPVACLAYFEFTLCLLLCWPDYGINWSKPNKSTSL